MRLSTTGDSGHPELVEGRSPAEVRETFPKGDTGRIAIIQRTVQAGLFSYKGETRETTMAITREKKAQLLVQLKGVVNGALSIAFVRFKSLTTKETNEVRQALKEENVRYAVVKKTLLFRTLKEAGIEGDMPSLDGEVAIAYLPKEASDDPSTPARNLNSFVQKFKGKLSFLGGVIEGKFLSKSETETFAAIPSTPVLRGMFVNIINSPIQRFVIALNQVAEKKSN